MSELRCPKCGRQTIFVSCTPDEGPELTWTLHAICTFSDGETDCGWRGQVPDALPSPPMDPDRAALVMKYLAPIVTLIREEPSIAPDARNEADYFDAIEGHRKKEADAIATLTAALSAPVAGDLGGKLKRLAGLLELTGITTDTSRAAKDVVIGGIGSATDMQALADLLKAIRDTTATTASAEGGEGV